jgi:predicted acetyltransferase
MLDEGYPHIGAKARGVRSSSGAPAKVMPDQGAAKTVRLRPTEQDKKSIMADPYPIRPVTREESAAFRDVEDHAFHSGVMPPDRIALWGQLFDPERSLAAIDPSAITAGSGSDGAIVGTAGAFTLQMAVPGAVLPVAGVSYVSVLPTHRRRGILRSMMRRQLSDIAARGEEPVAALWASEASLYGRYGYGRASSDTVFSFERGEGAVNSPADPALSLRLVAPADALPELAKVYDTVLLTQPGFFERDERWWARALYDSEGNRGGAGPLRCLLVSDAAGPRGYALYSALQRWDHGEYLPNGLITVRELVAADPAAGAALWRDLLSRDLAAEFVAAHRPLDDPLLYQLADPRRARPLVSDGLWVRIIDLPRALASRAYSCAVDVVLEVTDSLLPSNAGRWRLHAAAPGSVASVSCEPTAEAASVALDIRELGAAYLGGTRLGALAAAGLVTEVLPGALAPLSAAMTWDPAPWCPVIF